MTADARRLHTLAAPSSPLHPLLLTPHLYSHCLTAGGAEAQGLSWAQAGKGLRAHSFIQSFILQAAASPSLSGQGWGWVSTRWVAEGTQGDPEGTKDKWGLRKDRVASVTRKVSLRGKSPLHGTQDLRPHMTPHTGRVPRPSQLPSKELAFIAVLQSPEGLRVGTCRKHSSICRGSLLPRPRVGGSEFRWGETSSFPHLPNSPTLPGAWSPKGSIWLIQAFLRRCMTLEE